MHNPPFLTNLPTPATLSSDPFTTRFFREHDPLTPAPGEEDAETREAFAHNRPDAVARGKQLANDPDYPGTLVIRRLAREIARHLNS